jgi:hypothetical protein
MTTGKLAAQSWLRNLGLTGLAVGPWHVEVTLEPRDAAPGAVFDERRDTRFRIEIYSEEWGVFFCHAGKASWIRVTDIAFVHGRDDHGLLASMPRLEDIGLLLRAVERTYAVSFRREHALIRTNLPSIEGAVRLWIRSL